MAMLQRLMRHAPTYQAAGVAGELACDVRLPAETPSMAAAETAAGQADDALCSSSAEQV
jgi:hypothetical protein